MTGSTFDPGRITMRFREGRQDLLELPWDVPLLRWDRDDIQFVDLPVGASRHTVRFIVVADGILALKELPLEVGQTEYDVMHELELRGAPAVRAVGLVTRSGDQSSIIATRYLARSFQFRRLFMRLPEGERRYRDRLLDAMTGLLVEVHRTGLFWGDCSLANTLLMRDGQRLQAYLVDAETSEIHEQLSDGQRETDLEIAIENVAGDLADLAVMNGRSIDDMDDDFEAAMSLRDRYEGLWDILHTDVNGAARPALPRRPSPARHQRARLRRRRGHPRARRRTTPTTCACASRSPGATTTPGASASSPASRPARASRPSSSTT